MRGDDALIESLPPLQRLALAYAPKTARAPTLALLALDTRLAGIVRHSHEPMLAQLRLAWWREQLAADPATWPRGEPLLAALASWRGHEAKLVALAEGWEQLTGTAPLPASAIDGFAEGRARGFVALADLLETRDKLASVRSMARVWALTDLADHVGNAEERVSAEALAGVEMLENTSLSRPMRTLVVLHSLAQRRATGGISALIATLRLGLFGR
ncbi:MAG TPA: squalene/phytoene synthase family protein [Novosphingobium sp.]